MSFLPLSSSLSSLKKGLVTALAVTALFSACGAPRNANMFQPNAVNTMNTLNNVRFQRQNVSALNQDQLQSWLPLFKEIYGAEFADALQKGEIPADLKEKLKVYGPQAFQMLSQDPAARQQLYPASDAMVIREFTKPSPSDSIPPISSQENQALLAKLQPGDVILCGNDGSFIHGALYIGNGKVVHALATQSDMMDRFRGVVEESWETYTQRSERDTLVVLRSQLNTADLQRVIGYARAQKGKGYDSLFLNASDERFYCIELVWKALKQAQKAPRMFSHQVPYGWDIVAVEDMMDSPDFQTVYQRNYQRPRPGQLHRY
jgi:hypothetical protein